MKIKKIAALKRKPQFSEQQMMKMLVETFMSSFGIKKDEKEAG